MTMKDQCSIRSASVDDSAAIAEIYEHWVRETVVSFETEAPNPAEIARRLGNAAARHPWLVAEVEGQIVGYAYATAWKGRPAYDGSVESTIYLASGQEGRGLGFELYKALLKRLWEAGVHTVLGGIALPNPASVALHEKLGFTKVAHLRELGFKHGGWVDVGYWQLVFRDET